MRKMLLVAAMSLGLSGCAGLSDFVQNAAPTVAAVQRVAVAVCGFLPTASTIASILAAGNPMVATAEAIAAAICNAVTPARLGGRLGAGRPNVGGVVIHGRFIR